MENKFVLLQSRIRLLYRKCQLMDGYRKSLNWSNGHTNAGGQMCMTETWLRECGWWGSWLHRMCLENKAEHCLSHLWESKRGGYFYMNTSWGMPCRAVGHSHSKQLQVAQTLPSFLVLPPPFSPPTPRDQSSWTRLDRADITMLACAALSGSWEADATGVHC